MGRTSEHGDKAPCFARFAKLVCVFGLERQGGTVPFQD
jgi:hypothetical protein